ncbi:hypothetical protein RIF29_20371 [Crotalaria pallida]|uniref:Uncharacterized protein n=1 Tax=Crotalaria pallida TaxID=3830 RepID=A0AAN9F9J7_CROPI
MFTPPSKSKLQPQSSLLKSKITNCDKRIENGDLNLSTQFLSVESVQVYQIRSMLSDITNITQSTKQCSTNLTHVNERNSDILAGKVETKKKDTSSNKKKRLDQEVKSKAVGTEKINLSNSIKGKEKGKQTRLDLACDKEVGKSN